MAKKLLTTGRGIAVYPHLTKPDTKFDADGVYTIKLQQTGQAAEELARKIDAAITDAAAGNGLNEKQVAALKAASAKGKRVKVADAPYTRNDDGSVTFSFKMKAKGKTRTGEVFERKPVIFDRSGKPVQGLRIGGGSTVSVSFEISPFFTALVGAGVSLRLEAVQVIELVEFGGNASYFGFQNEAEGEDAAQLEGGSAAEELTEGAAPAGSGDDF